MPDYLPIPSAAKSAGISERTLRDWVKRGILLTTTARGSRRRLVDVAQVRQVAASRGMPSANSGLPDSAEPANAAVLPISLTPAISGAGPAEAITPEPAQRPLGSPYTDLPLALERLAILAGEWDTESAQRARLVVVGERITWLLALVAVLLATIVIIGVWALLTR